MKLGFRNIKTIPRFPHCFGVDLEPAAQREHKENQEGAPWWREIKSAPVWTFNERVMYGGLASVRCSRGRHCGSAMRSQDILAVKRVYHRPGSGRSPGAVRAYWWILGAWMLGSMADCSPWSASSAAGCTHTIVNRRQPFFTGKQTSSEFASIRSTCRTHPCSIPPPRSSSSPAHRRGAAWRC